MRAEEIEELVRGGCAALGMALSSAEERAVVGYVGLLLKWNQRINLVGTKDVGLLVQHHIVDALVVAGFVPDDASRLIDVGSGAGIPGALIAIRRPDLQVTALEPVHKKQAFIAAVRRELGLENLHPLAVRMEVHRQAEGFMGYDVAVSRATFAVPEWLSRGRTLVHVNGVVLAMEGRELHELPEGVVRHAYRLGERQRAIVVLRVS